MFKSCNLTKHLNDFLKLYQEAPVVNNEGGMKLPHLYGLYYILKELKPKLVVESGVWKGQGTWLIRQVLPSAEIICFDVNLNRLLFIDKAANYINHDITEFDWSVFYQQNRAHSPATSLLFLDDHVDFPKRFDILKSERPFKYVIYEDNYPNTCGDCLSPKKIVDSVSESSNITPSHSFVSELNKKSFDSLVASYDEFPPIAPITTTRWGAPMTQYKTEPSILQSKDLLPLKYQEEVLSYTWMCLMEMHI